MCIRWCRTKKASSGPTCMCIRWGRTKKASRSYSREVLRAIHSAADERAAEPHGAWKDNAVSPLPGYPGSWVSRAERRRPLFVRVEIRTDEFYQAVDVEGLREKAVARVISW